MPLLYAEGISHTYNGKDLILNNVNVDINQGDFVSILGPSGSGKTTLLSILAGLEKPTKGQVYLGDTEITGLSEKKLAILRRTKISFVFQFFNLAPYLTLEENILVPEYLNGVKKKDVEGRLNYLLDLLDLRKLRKKLPATLSGGEQQRCAIARSLIFDPEVIFLDEPTGNLDSVNSKNVMELLMKINEEKNTTIIQVTHSEENAKYGKTIIHLKDGKIVRTRKR